jgi:electron transport complex protein RnfA
MLAMSRRFEVASGMAAMTIVLLPILCVAAFVIEHQVLVPLGAEPLGLLVWVLLGFLIGAAADVVIRRAMPSHAALFLPYLPFFGVNCLVLGAVLGTLDAAESMVTLIGWSLGTAAGYAAVLLIVTGIRERLAMTSLPLAMRGAPALVLSMGILAVALAGLRGIG